MNDAPQGTALAAPMPSRMSSTPLRQVKKLDELWSNAQFLERIEAALPEHMKASRMLRVFALAATTNPGLMTASLPSFVGACLTTTQLGLEPNTPLGQAYLIPFRVNKYNPQTKQREHIRTDVNFIAGYKGLMDLSYRTGKVVTMHSDLVWPDDLNPDSQGNPRFSYEYGSNAHLVHRPLFVPRDPNSDNPREPQPAFAYCHVKLTDGQAFLVWPWQEVLRTRSMSQGYRTAMAHFTEQKERGKNPGPTYTEAPWVKHRNAMGRKTMVRNISNMLPRSIELATAVHLDSAADRRSISLGNVMDAPTIDGVPDFLGAAAAAADMADQEADWEDAEERDAEGRAGSAGSAFTDRRESTSTQANPATTGQTGAAAGQTQGQTAATTTAPADKAPPVATTGGGGFGEAVQQQRQETQASAVVSFEAVLIDAAGDPVGDFIDPMAYAQALARGWELATPEQAALLVEYNADTIDSLREHPQAGPLLAPLDEPKVAGVALEIVAVPHERGRPQWALWTQGIKTSLADIAAKAPSSLPDWLELQRANIQLAPLTQRPLVLRAVVTTLAQHKMHAPPWMSDMGKPKGDAKPAQDGAAAPAAQAAQQQPDKDKRWAENISADIAACQTIGAIDEFGQNGSIRTVMARLKTERPELWKMVDDAAAKRRGQLTAPPQGGSLDEADPFPPEAGDPGAAGAP